MNTPKRPPGRPAKPMFPPSAQLPPLEAASEGEVSVEVACAEYLGGIGLSKFYELVRAR